ncbi:hypothetical protein AB0C38_21775 [Amycolatopsis sp. NPDC048633]|uniref:hypothetical protein n=1 Tax=Amycolatopsis sp. NPDC048633 TaxID=3157095 RepID=UPI0033FDEBE0
MTHGTEFHGRGSAPAHPGRHRLGGTDGWTPPLPPNRAGRRHAAGPAPVDPPVSGSLPLAQPRSGTQPLPQPSSGEYSLAHPRSGEYPLAHPMSGTHPLAQPRSGEYPLAQPMSGALPLPQPSLPQPRDRRPAPPLFPASHGSLPLEEDLEPVEPPRPETRADQAARRTRVKLATPQPRCVDQVDQEDDDVRIYAAPPIDGLGGFTIGSVPASVTPPKTWRKAAWFATGASGAVVVGLLFAGSYMVGKPPVDQAVQGAWPGYQGAPTVIDPTGEAEPPSRQGGSAPGPDDSTPSSEKPAGRTSGGGAGPVDGVPPPPPADSTAGSKTTGTTTPSGRPQKPPVAPAQRETPVKPPWWYSFPPDAQTMGDNSEKFFNTVTTDPAAASAVTTGDLHDQGPQALAERYAGVAYFEVRKISIDQQRGVTVNTVEITHTDGSKTIEERTLTFGDGDKIAADGQ